MEGIILTAKHKSHKHESHKHTPTAHPSHRKVKKRPNYVLGVAVLLVLVAIVYGIIVLLNRAGDMRDQPDVAAFVNDEPITMAYLDEQYTRIPAEFKSFVTKMVLLNQTINEVILLQEAKSEGVEASDEDVEAQIRDAMSKAGLDDDQLDAKLAEQNLSRAFLHDLYKKQLTINDLLEKKVFVNIEVTPQEVQDYYDSRIRAAHILVEDKDEAEGLVLTLQRTSKSLLEEKFFGLAEEKSIDPSAKTNKGDLGEFTRGMMVPDFEDAVFALDEGEFTTEPVQTQFGYHVILRLPKDKSFDEQKAEIEDLLLLQKKSKAVPLYVEQLRSKAHIKLVYTGEASEKASEKAPTSEE